MGNVEDMLVNAHREHIAGSPAQPYMPAFGTYAYYTMEYALAQMIAEKQGVEFPKMPESAYHRGMRYYDEAWDEVENRYAESMAECEDYVMHSESIHDINW